MRWYARRGGLRKLALPLDPGAWKSDASPHRLLRHRDVVPTPYGGGFRRSQDPRELRRLYEGVHLAGSPWLSALYASGKASHDDPPVIIEIDASGLPVSEDVDTMNDYAMDVYMSDNRDKWARMLSSGRPADDVSDEFFNSVQEDADYLEFGQSGGDEDMSDLVQAGARMSPPAALMDYLGNKDADETLAVMSGLIAGRVPPEVSTAVTGQYRVMSSLGGGRVHAVYEIPLLSSRRPGNWEGMSDEAMEHEGLRRVGDDVYDSDDRLLLDYDDLDDPMPPVLRKLYVNESVPGGSWHGTSLSRARAAFPDLRL